MKDSDRRPAPPIPPRRLKRKNKPVADVTDEVVEATTTSAIRLEPRPRLPPPPPPQRGFPRREIRPQLLPTPEVRGNSFPGSYSKENCHSQSITGDKLSAGNEVEEVQPYLSTFGTTVCISPAKGSCKKTSVDQEPPRRKPRDKSKLSRPNEYPPLFFTLQDFQEVMADVDNSYSRTLKNMTTFEPTPKPRSSKISINDLPETPDKTEVLFRVTTTNVPFEKSLSEWADGGDDPNHFIFEDYVDRRQISAQRKSQPSSTKLVLFGDDTFDRDDDNQTISTSHTASRVRFRVDSPTRDESVEKIAEHDSLQNIDSLPMDNLPFQDLKLADKSRPDEIEDEFGDIPFDSLLNTANDPLSSLCVDFSEDSTSSKSDFQTILVTALVEPIPSVAINEKPMDDGKSSGSSVDVNEEEKPGTLLIEEATSTDENINYEPGILEPKIFLASETQVLESERKSETAKIVTLESSEDKNNSIDLTVQKDNKKKLLVDESLIEFMEELTNEDKSPPENVRRNSFMMNMLQEDELDERVVCKVVATHPKTPIHRSKVDGINGRGEPSAAVEAKSKLLGELSSSFSAIRLKPVNHYVGDVVDEKQSASDLINVVEVKNGDVDDIVMKKEEDDNNIGIKYKFNRNLDSVLDSNVVKCKVIEEPIEESMNFDPLNEPQDSSNVCSQKTDEIIDKNKYVEDVDSVYHDEETKIESRVEDVENIKKKKKKKKKKEEEEEEDNNNKNDNDNDGDNHSGNNIINNNNDNTNNNNNNNSNVEVASRSSVDKCAIVLQCNDNNDNNAMTPVDVSYDQSPNNVSIIPGSVRSFVKFYEIRGETSVGLNSIDTNAAAAAAAGVSAAAVPRIKVEAIENAPDNSGEIKSKNMIEKPILTEIENDIKYTIVKRKPVVKKKHLQNHTVSNYENQYSDKLCKSRKTDVTEPRTMPIKIFKTDGKKNAQLISGSGFVRSTSLVENEEEEIEKECKRERRSRSSISKKSTRTTQRTHSAASGISHGIQDVLPSGLGTKDVVRSGTTNHSVPKSSTSTINEHYTFYCTV